jgi:hypothetical protein
MIPGIGIHGHGTAVGTAPGAMDGTVDGMILGTIRMVGTAGMIYGMTRGTAHGIIAGIIHGTTAGIIHIVMATMDIMAGIIQHAITEEVAGTITLAMVLPEPSITGWHISMVLVEYQMVG